MLSLGIRYEKYTQLLITTSSMHLSSRYRWVSRFKYCCIDSSRFFLVYPEVPRAIRSIVSFTILDQACCLHYSLVFIVSSKVVRATFYIKTTKKMLTKIKPMSIIVFVFFLFFYIKDLFYAILTEEHSHMGCCYVWLLYGLVSFSTTKLKFL